MSEELEVLKIVTERLNKANISYMITGSIAMNYYTVPRMTRDIDIVIELKIENAYNFVRLFQGDFYIDENMVKSEVLRQRVFNIIHNQYVVKVDFIIRKESEFQNSAFSRKKKALIENTSMWFISAEDLILAKLLWTKDTHSEIQLQDISNLLRTIQNLDTKYINEWVEKLELVSIYKESENG